MNAARTKKADKLITKASSTFDNAVVQVQKANDLLEADIQNESKKIADLEAKISECQELIKSSLQANKDKLIKIKNNNQLIKNLKGFTLSE